MKATFKVVAVAIACLPASSCEAQASRDTDPRLIWPLEPGPPLLLCPSLYVVELRGIQ